MDALYRCWQSSSEDTLPSAGGTLVQSLLYCVCVVVSLDSHPHPGYPAFPPACYSRHNPVRESRKKFLFFSMRLEYSYFASAFLLTAFPLADSCQRRGRRAYVIKSRESRAHQGSAGIRDLPGEGNPHCGVAGPLPSGWVNPSRSPSGVCAWPPRMLTPGARTGRARETHFHWTGVRPCSPRLEKP